MRCLRESEVKDWLDERGVIESPYDKEPHHSFLGQFEIPQDGSARAFYFAGHMIRALGPFDGALIVLTDWVFYTEEQMTLACAVRKAHGESRPLIEAPAHLFERTEQALAIGLFALTMVVKWKSYFYFPSGETLYNWEGELLDYFVNSEFQESELIQTARNFLK